MNANDNTVLQKPDRYAVFGKPVAHSLSPRIHAMFAAQCAAVIDYTRREIEDGDFEQAVANFFAAGGAGLNITQPYKQRAAAMAQQLGTAATAAGAANTLYMHNGQLHAENTDGTGLVRDLQQNLGWSIEDARLLLVGAGGAVRGVLEPLLACRPASVTLANRTAAKAEQLEEIFAETAGAFSVSLQATELAALQRGYDIVINGSSAGLSGTIPALDASVVDGARCYDLVYGAGAAPFLQWAAQSGARSLADGLGMLVEQAAAAFHIWRGVHPETRTVIEQLRDAS
ncbi:MAG: shikimate dehydrogenase [Pseudomonadales bacterium]